MDQARRAEAAGASLVVVVAPDGGAAEELSDSTVGCLVTAGGVELCDTMTHERGGFLGVVSTHARPAIHLAHSDIQNLKTFEAQEKMRKLWNCIARKLARK